MRASTKILIRKIEKRDFGRVSEITNYYFPHVRASPSKIARRLSKGFDYLVAVVGGVVAGFADFKLKQSRVKLMGLAVDCESRERGIGSALLEKLSEVAAKEGKGSVYLRVKRNNLPAIRLYQSKGFVIDKDVEKGAESFYMMSKKIEI